ncbi:hypothetical protein [Clostridium sp. MD294]|uniref:hypothetical protein n=1 Tax=Clostridium sp. MD294 TaxID=97138 RepID=UPI00039A53FF|nr:hypothetical protein [Clostridium sp. MD294]NDO46251.1 hypothetical protein [Clostridium sp. MD294]
MNVLKLSKWTICVEKQYRTVQQGNIMIVLDQQRNFVVLFSVDEDHNIIIEKCCTGCQCEIDHKYRRILLEVV